MDIVPLLCGTAGALIAEVVRWNQLRSDHYEVFSGDCHALWPKFYSLAAVAAGTLFVFAGSYDKPMSPLACIQVGLSTPFILKQLLRGKTNFV